MKIIRPKSLILTIENSEEPGKMEPKKSFADMMAIKTKAYNE